MTLQESVHDFYQYPATMSAVDKSIVSTAPREVAPLVRYVQGLLLHEFWGSEHGVEVSAERKCESHIRPVSQILDQVLTLDGQPLSATRPVHKRLVGTCRHFSLLLVALLRQQGVPARARCGFATYFVPGQFIDHWVGEYWNDAESSWLRVDAQLDDLQREKLETDFDPLDVPHDRFLVAGDAWALCRSGEADPATFGIHDMHGLWFIAGDLLRDLAALNKTEMLPWDVWGVMPSPDESLKADQLEFFDQIAAVTCAPELSVTELRKLYQDARLQVPTTVFNAVRERAETV